MTTKDSDLVKIVALGFGASLAYVASAYMNQPEQAPELIKEDKPKLQRRNTVG